MITTISRSFIDYLCARAGNGNKDKKQFVRRLQQFHEGFFEHAPETEVMFYVLFFFFLDDSDDDNDGVPDSHDTDDDGENRLY